MADFPQFVKHPANLTAPSSPSGSAVEGYLFDGADGSQVAFRTCTETAISPQHVHEQDEYMVVVEGSYLLLIQGKQVELKAGQEYFIPKGIPHGSRVLAGTRSIHAFGGRRVVRSAP